GVGPADLLREAAAEEAQLPHLPVEIVRELSGLLQLPDAGADLLDTELADERPEFLHCRVRCVGRCHVGSPSLLSIGDLVAVVTVGLTGTVGRETGGGHRRTGARSGQSQGGTELQHGGEALEESLSENGSVALYSPLPRRETENGMLHQLTRLWNDRGTQPHPPPRTRRCVPICHLPSGAEQGVDVGAEAWLTFDP